MSVNLCDKVGSNTGDIKCDSRRGRPVILAYGGKTFSSEEYSDASNFKAAFKACTILPTGDPDKIYCIPENVGTNDQTGAPKTSTLGSYGPDVVLVEGRSAYEFDLAIGITLEKKLRELNGETVPFFIWDDKKNMWGADDGEGGFVGYDCIVSVIAKPFEDGKDARVTKFKISMISASQFADDGVYVPAKGFKGSDFKGLNDVHLRIIGVSDDQATYRIAPEIPTSIMGQNLNIFDDYKSSALANESSWLAFATVSGTETDIDVISVDATGDALDAVVAAAATGLATVTGFGADGDTIDVKLDGVSISGGQVTKTSSETTAALLATKVKTAINTNTTTNGKISAANTTGAITLTSDADNGASNNTKQVTFTIVGTITATSAPFTGGVDGTDEIDAGEGFSVSIDSEAVGDLSVGDMITITTIDVSGLQAVNVKGIETTEPAEHVKAA